MTLKRSPLHRKTFLRRTPLRRRRKPVRLEPGRAEFKAVQHGVCGVCGAVGLVRRHHVVTEQKVGTEGGDPWALENALWIGVEGVTCDCHAHHHSKSRRIPLELVPDAAAAFALDLLGEDRAADWFRRHYDCGEGA